MKRTREFVMLPEHRKTALLLSACLVLAGAIALGQTIAGPPDSTSTQQKHFAYRLDGGEWTPFPTKSHSVPLRLNRWVHTLEVRVQNGHPDLGPEPAMLRFTVLPPLWKHPGFIGLVLGALLILGLQAVRLQRRGRSLRSTNAALRRVQEELERRVEARTAELQAANIQLQNEILERTQTEETLQQTVEKLNTLVDIFRLTGSILDPDVLLDRLLRHLVRVIPAAECGTVYLYDAPSETLLPAACLGLEREAFHQLRLQPGETLAGCVLQTGQPQLTGNQQETEAFQKYVRPENAHLLSLARRGQEIRSSLCVPLKTPNGEIVGTLLLGATQAVFTEADLSLLEGISSEATITIQNARLFEQVRTGRERLEALSQRLVQVQEAERKRIARELHDEIGQLLTGLKLSLEMSLRLLPEEAGASLGEAQTLVNELIAQVRDLSLDLRPAMLDDLGLLSTLLWHLERYTAQTGIQVHFTHSGLEGHRFAPEAETAAYRIVQEALTNVARHAGVREAAVRIQVDPRAIHVQVQDEGAGFDPGAALAAGVSSGLSGMQERTLLLGGRFSLESTPGAGALLSVELPLEVPSNGETQP